MMYPLVKLGHVITHRKESIIIHDTQTYMRCRVQSYGKGVVLRDIVTGADIKTKRQQVCRAGEFLVAEIDAKVGGFGIVPPELDGAVVSSHYFLFTLDETQIEQRYLSYYVRTPDFQDQTNAQGSTNYAAIRPQHVLDYVIPLPPIDEQRRIVAHIDALAEQIAVARGLRQGAMQEAAVSLSHIVGEVLTSTRAANVTVESVALHVTDGDHLPPPKQDSGDVPFIFISNITTGKLSFENCKYVSWDYFNALAPSRVPKAGDILYTAVGATYGRPCLVIEETPFCFQRHIAIIKPDREKVLSTYLYWALFSQSIYQQATRSITGTAQPTVPLRAIRKLSFPLPSIEIQNGIVAYLDGLQAEVERLKRMQTDTAVELDALLPSLLDRAFRSEL